MAKGSLWLHRKRQTVYREVGTAILQTGRPLTDGAKLVLYTSPDGSWYVRPESEFRDGRFVRAKFEAGKIVEAESNDAEDQPR